MSGDFDNAAYGRRRINPERMLFVFATAAVLMWGHRYPHVEAALEHQRRDDACHAVATALQGLADTPCEELTEQGGFGQMVHLLDALLTGAGATAVARRMASGITERRR